MDSFVQARCCLHAVVPSGLTQIDKVCCITATNAVKVYLCTWPTWTLVTHLPEVVLQADNIEM